MEKIPTDQNDFVGRINGKDPEAWKELYARYYKALCSYSSALTSDAVSAEDIVQELLLRLWQSEPNFPTLPEMAAYLYRAVYHNSLAYLRDRNNRTSILRNMHENYIKEEKPHLGREDEMEMLAGIVGEEVIRRLHMDIRELPAEQSRIIRLSIEGFKGEEIARRLGISINTVKTQKYRGYRSLRLRLSKYFLYTLGVLALLSGRLSRPEIG